MTGITEETTAGLRLAVTAAADKAICAGELVPKGDLPDFSIEIPADREHGDYACNAAMAWAKCFRTAPQRIAESLVRNIDLSNTMCEKVEIAGPGFMNFFLSAAWYREALSRVLNEGENYGTLDVGRGKKVMVEFVSANPTGPMHIGNARGGALGDCLASVLERAGYDVTREFYINDAGNQIQKFGASLEARYMQLFDGNFPFPDDGYLGDDITERARQFADIYGDKYVGAASDERRKALTDFALPLNIESLKNDLLEYRITYDVWFPESSLYESGELKRTIERMKSADLTYEKEGALWYRATEHGGEKDEVLIRANGLPTYFASDIAYHLNKFEVRGFDKVIDVWGADHHGHVARLKGALAALGIDPSRLDVVLMQLVRLIRNGETVRVSKRTGKTVSLKTLLDEAPLDAARFIFNSKEPNTHLDFDLDLAVEQSNDNPVYYVQYAYARICSILRLAGADENFIPCSENYNLLQAPEEKELIRFLALLPETVKTVAEKLDSAGMTRYVTELAGLFHKFYNACRVRCDDKKLSSARLDLCRGTATVIKVVLSMLKITAPETM